MRLDLPKRHLPSVLMYPPRTVSHWLAGEREPPYEALVRIKEITGVSLDWLLAGPAHGE